jgi:LAO/AO transport system kinase
MALRMMLDLNTGGGHTVMHHGRLMTAVAETEERDKKDRWRPTIHMTVATRQEGIDELAEAIRAHRAHLEQSGELARRERERAAAELEMIVQHESLRQVLDRTDQVRLSSLIDRIVGRELDPYTASLQLLHHE